MTATPALLGLLSTDRTGELTASWHCPAGYRQGRGAWGGLPVGAMLDSAMAVVGDDELVPRSLTSHLVGPVAPGPAQIALTVLRRGSATVTVSALLTAREAGPDGDPVGDQVVVADAVIAFGRARALDLDLAAMSTMHPPPALDAGWSSLPVAEFPPGLAPEFFDKLAVRPISGFPGSSSPVGQTLGWVAPPDGMVDDPRLLACLADAWWPSTLVMLPSMRPMATLSFTLDLIDTATGGQPVLHHGRLQSGGAGYVAETRELWSADGRLLSVNQQTMVVIR